jgi:hypothetical protein
LEIKITKTVILSFVLYGCRTRALMLREEHRVRVFVNKIPRTEEREEGAGWRKLLN